MSSLMQYLVEPIPELSPVSNVRRWSVPARARKERYIRTIVSLAAALAALVLFATATHG